MAGLNLQLSGISGLALILSPSSQLLRDSGFSRYSGGKLGLNLWLERNFSVFLTVFGILTKNSTIFLKQDSL